MKKAVVLLSGGMDSTTCLAIAKSEGYSCHALSFSYGQKHSIELKAAQRIAQNWQVTEHRIVNLDLSMFAGSALIDKQLSIPEHQKSNQIPSTYVPARNTIFLSIALGYAESLGARTIFIGASSVDYSHYPDCRPEFISTFQELANQATKAGVEGDLFRIYAPLQYLSKAETILLGQKLGVDYSITLSCYQATEQSEACGCCESCMLRKKGFAEAQVPDPTLYHQNIKK